MSMDIERAKEIAAACIKNRAAIAMGQDYIPLPDCTLAEMLEANEMMANHNEQPDEDGRTTIYAHCAPRGIAASYAYEQYGSDLMELAAAVGLGCQ